MAEVNVLIGKNASVIRATMRDGIVHCRNVCRKTAAAIDREDTVNSAHRSNVVIKSCMQRAKCLPNAAVYFQVQVQHFYRPFQPIAEG